MDIIRELNGKSETMNCLKCFIILGCLREYLEPFIEEEITVFHQLMSEQCGCVPCANNCNFSNWNPTHNQPIPPFDCEVCTAWRDAILTHHSNQNGKVIWTNSKPHLWSQDKWQVAKVYMPNGHKNHNSLGDFDIAALLCLMNQCKHFEKFKLRGLCEKVSFVRNSIMHSPNYQLKKKDLDNYMKRIRKLCNVLVKHHPNFGSLSREIDEIQRLDLTLLARDNQAQNEEELEDKLVAALEVNRKTQNTQDLLGTEVEELEKTLSERDEEIKTLHLFYKEELKAALEVIIKTQNTQDLLRKKVKKLKKTLSERDREIKTLCLSYKEKLKAVEQEASEPLWMKMVKFLGEKVRQVMSEII
ncbi:uncharacterized protein CXorf38 homolog isoform X1 [Thunnus albacares]|uniref:uncharacterized protein CXorf38 homolog isoform X1 n=1 Tax=Thunnus albacares TaxID=8236 RepID=UPI001CF61B21|nr:uncharacterized protein CXorf38 homolog isoform X1 [Thunnus albacares]